MLAHQILLLFFFSMFESLCGGDPFQSQKVSQTNTITNRVLKGKVMRRLLDFIALDRISFQVLPHQNLWGRNLNQALAPVVLSLKHSMFMHLPHAPGNPYHSCECGRSQAG